MNTPENTTSSKVAEALEFELNNEHAIRTYLKMMLRRIEFDKTLEPQCIVTAVKLPTGAIEIAVNHDHIVEKIRYILSAYDCKMQLSHSPKDGAIEMVEVFIV